MEYKDKETALIHLGWEREKVKSKQCPVFKTKCMGEKCQSYYDGTVFLLKKDKEGNQIYNTVNPTCQSPLVTGIIYHEEN